MKHNDHERRRVRSSGRMGTGGKKGRTRSAKERARKVKENKGGWRGSVILCCFHVAVCVYKCVSVCQCLSV